MAARASVIATLSLLAWAATASAECAWLLWQEDTFTEPYEKTWFTPLAYPSRAACVARIEERVKQWREGSSPQQSVRRDTSGTSAEFVTRTSPGRALISRSHCLPDTVDPRGPKTK